MVLSSHAGLAGPLHCCPVMYRLNVSVRGAWYPCIVCYPPLHPCTSLYPYPCILLSCHIPLYGAAMHTVLSGGVQLCTPEWQVDDWHRNIRRCSYAVQVWLTSYSHEPLFWKGGYTILVVLRLAMHLWMALSCRTPLYDERVFCTHITVLTKMVLPYTPEINAYDCCQHPHEITQSCKTPLKWCSLAKHPWNRVCLPHPTEIVQSCCLQPCMVGGVPGCPPEDGLDPWFLVHCSVHTIASTPSDGQISW